MSPWSNVTFYWCVYDIIEWKLKTNSPSWTQAEKSSPPLLFPHLPVKWWSCYLPLRAEKKVNRNINKQNQQLCREADGRQHHEVKMFVQKLNALFVLLCITLTSSVSFVLDFSRASTLAWRLFTDALKTNRNIILFTSSNKVKWVNGKTVILTNLRCLFNSST